MTETLPLQEQRALRREIKAILAKIEEFYPLLYSLGGRLTDAGYDLGEPLPQNGTLKSIADYARAVIGLARFLDAIGHALLQLAGEGKK
jgi:hypothetical protein